MLPAFDRYKWFVTHYADLVLRVPAKYIPSYLGLSESTLSRLKSNRQRGTLFFPVSLGVPIQPFVALYNFLLFSK